MITRRYKRSGLGGWLDTLAILSFLLYVFSLFIDDAFAFCFFSSCGGLAGCGIYTVTVTNGQLAGLLDLLMRIFDM